MGRKLHYRPGSFYRVDDRTGFPQRAENTKKEWTGLIVSPKVWEPRQPQDLVKGVPDVQAVEDPRPLSANVFVGPIYLQMTENLGPGSPIIPVQSTALVTIGDTAAVFLSDGSLFPCVIIGLVATGPAVVIIPSLPGYADSGDEIIDYRIPYAGTVPKYLTDEQGNPILTENGELILLETA